MENENVVKKLSLKEKVDSINQKLVDAARDNVDVIQINTIGKKQVGFKPQYIFDAINEVLGPDNWRYETKVLELLNTPYRDKNDVEKICSQAIMETKLFIRVDDEWIAKGTHYGQCPVVQGNVGDAIKGATTDSLQKVFSTISVGNLAYSGRLEALYNQISKNGGSKSKNQQQSKPQNQQQPAQPPITGEKADLSDHDLPVLAGIDFIINENRFVATGDKNVLFNNKVKLKSGGFQWSGTERIWFKEMPQQQ
ncbi:MAG: hypothetical protein PHI97_00395 [Desulfobulbus sp.]|nr:hypothetical protein [Desulfobulbus sp.]